MPPSLSELKVIPSFCFSFKIPDNVTATNYIRTTVSYGCRASVSGISIRNKNSIVLLRSPCFSLIQKKYKAVELGMGSHMFLIGPSYLPYLAICRQHLLLANNRTNFFWNRIWFLCLTIPRDISLLSIFDWIQNHWICKKNRWIRKVDCQFLRCLTP